MNILVFRIMRSFVKLSLIDDKKTSQFWSKQNMLNVMSHDSWLYNININAEGAKRIEYLYGFDYL